MTQVTGINPGEEVATSSFDKLQDNSKVNSAKNAAPAANNAGSSNP
jgi:multidrug efflux system membrane fusion protein